MIHGHSQAQEAEGFPWALCSLEPCSLTWAHSPCGCYLGHGLVFLTSVCFPCMSAPNLRKGPGKDEGEVKRRVGGRASGRKE